MDKIQWIKEGIAKVSRYVHIIGHEYVTLHGNLLAKGIAFSFLLTFFPIVMIAIWLLSIIVADGSHLESEILATLLDITPQVATDYLQERIQNIASHRLWSKIGITGIIILFWAPNTLFTSIEQALYKVMKTDERRSFLIRKAYSFTLHIVIILIIILFSFISMMLNSIGLFTDLPPYLSFISSKGVSTLVIWTSLMLIYWICYHGKIKKSALVITSFIISLIWQILNSIGSSIITLSGKNEAFYGILAGVAVVMSWAFLFSAFLLIGGQVIARQSRPKESESYLDYEI